MGYFPGIASINNYPVYIENRNGNSNLKYKQAETLKRAYGVLAEFGMKDYEMASIQKNIT